MESFCSQAYTSKGLITLKTNAPKSIYTYILKGYPDSLKQKFIEKIKNSTDCECSSSYNYNEKPVSLLCKDKGFRIIDGTFPNTAEPEIYGITDSIIDIGAFQNTSALQKDTSKIMYLFNEIKKEEKRCVGFISAAKGIVDDCRRCEASYINRSEINRFSSKLWKRYGIIPSGCVGNETKFFADILNGEGTAFPFEKFSGLCETVSIISDFSSVISYHIADKLRLYALSCGLDVISFADFLDTATIRHIIIPELKYGFYSAGRNSDINITNQKKIKTFRFMNQNCSDYIKNKKQFCRKAYCELMHEAAESIKRIDDLKQRLDNIYFSATDISSFICNNELKVTRIDKSLQKVYNVNDFCL